MNTANRPTTLALAALGAAALLSACATTGPIGAVLPLEGGRFQSSVNGLDQANALKAFTNDAELTCGGGASAQKMPWQATKPAGPVKYAVVSQTLKSKDGKEIKAENKNLEAGIAVGLRYIGLEAQDKVEVTTVFRCL